MNLPCFEPWAFLLAHKAAVCISQSYLFTYPHLSPYGNLVPGWICRSRLPFLPVVFLPEAAIRFENTLQLGEFLLLLNLAFPSKLLLISEKTISAYYHDLNQGFPKSHAGTMVSSMFSILPQLLPPPLISLVKLIP